MTEQEKLNSKVKRKIAVQNANIKALTEELREFKNEMRDFKQEMRQQNQMRAAEITEIRQTFQALHRENLAIIIGLIAILVAVFTK